MLHIVRFKHSNWLKTIPLYRTVRYVVSARLFSLHIISYLLMRQCVHVKGFSILPTLTHKIHHGNNSGIYCLFSQYVEITLSPSISWLTYMMCSWLVWIFFYKNTKKSIRYNQHISKWKTNLESIGMFSELKFLWKYSFAIELHSNLL